MNADDVKKGTTTVGLTCSDGVVFATDRRASMGYFIASKEAKKMFLIDDHIAITVAGMVADAQALARIMKAEAQLYKLQKGKPINVEAACSLMSNIMHQYKWYPFLVQIIIGGLDEKPRIFTLDAVGGVTEERFVSTGSGSPMVYGLLEEAFKEGKPVKENLKLAVKCVATAMKRDCASGDGIDLISITKQGPKQYSDDEIKKILEDKSH
ncbi:archaeal proteasome endopeptidase complex subunit beta [Candidatus Micrarchaeota archaeon]|nr:archaeal proteasome endopeptidase complex subunit beta [Candidatus Micrarchaeota archaeon]